MRWRRKSFKIDVDLYQTGVFVSFGDLEGLRVLLRGQDNPPSEKELDGIVETCVSNVEDYDGLTVPLQNRFHILYFPRKLISGVDFLSVINHEVFHATYGICSGVGISLTEESQEAFAYLNGYLNKKIYDQLQ